MKELSETTKIEKEVSFKKKIIYFNLTFNYWNYS